MVRGRESGMVIHSVSLWVRKKEKLKVVGREVQRESGWGFEMDSEWARWLEHRMDCQWERQWGALRVGYSETHLDSQRERKREFLKEMINDGMMGNYIDKQKKYNLLVVGGTVGIFEGKNDGVKEEKFVGGNTR
jgi:hypothetical protein